MTDTPASAPDPTAEALASGLVAGDRRALARAITLIESTRPADRPAARALLAAAAATGRQALRIGLTGTPGAGKSTFIEAFGRLLTAQGHRVAVLAVDPSSVRSGGSILGDKTRMPLLARDPAAFIRPSPSGAQLGGVARRTREAVAICEGAGFDVVLIETVGVGQSETVVADLCDIFVLILAPAGGDELQGVKRGIMEVADLILVNKADGDTAAAAQRTLGDYAGALRLLRARPEDPAGFPLALAVSALTGAGIAEAWAAIGRLAAGRREGGHFATRREAQRRAWFEQELRAALLARIDASPGMRAAHSDYGEQVAQGRIDPETAALRVIEALDAPTAKG
jgi:LAO/AO transport system kinase